MRKEDQNPKSLKPPKTQRVKAKTLKPKPRSTDLIEIVPEAVVAGIESQRPTMIFKEKKGERKIPIWLSALDAGIALVQEKELKASGSPHKISSEVLKSLGVRLEKCVFHKVKGPSQYLNLYFSGSELIEKIEARADDSLSFCLHEEAPFFCTEGFIEECRDQEIRQETQYPLLKPIMKPSGGRPPYLM